LSDFKNFLIFSTEFQKLLQNMLRKPHPVAEELFHADTQTDE